MNGTETSDELALSSAIAVAKQVGAAKRGLLTQIRGAAAMQDVAEVDISEYFGALSDGMCSKGDKYLLKVLAVLTGFINSWVVLAMMGYSLWLMARKGSEQAKNLWAWIEKIGLIMAPIAAAGTILFKVFTKKKEHDEAYDAKSADPGVAIAMITSLAIAEVPIFGTMFSTLGALQDEGDEYNPRTRPTLRDGDDDDDEDAELSATLQDMEDATAPLVAYDDDHLLTESTVTYDR
jgi:hypothetical protein